MPRIFKAANVIEEPKIIIRVGKNDTEEEIEVQQEQEQPEAYIQEALIQEQVQEMLDEAQREAQTIIEKAKKEAELLGEKIKQEAQAQSQKEQEESKKEGYAEGVKQGTQEVDVLKQQAEAALAEAKEKKENTLHSLEEEVLDLVFSITDKLLSSTIQLNPQLILVILRQGLNESTVAGDIHIKVSAEDYEEVMKQKEVIFSMIDNATNIEILKDLSLEQSDCIIETPFGNIDCSLMEQYKILKETMYYILQTTKKKEEA